MNSSQKPISKINHTINTMMYCCMPAIGPCGD